MPPLGSKHTEKPSPTVVFLTGAAGYVGGHLLPLLERQPVTFRFLARTPDKLRRLVKESTQIAQGDVLDVFSLDAALSGVHTAYYLVHLTSSTQDIGQEDRQAATNFAQASKRAGVQRIVYLSVLGDESDQNLSPHLRSRHQVGKILQLSGVETIEIRAAMVIGAGSLSYLKMTTLAERLPVMICPRWFATPTQPIAVDDLLAYLLAAKDLPKDASRVFEVGSPDVVTYGDLIREYARQNGLQRRLIRVPVLTPYLSGRWLGLAPPNEGLDNPTVLRDGASLEVFPIRPMGVKEAIQLAIANKAGLSARLRDSLGASCRSTMT